MAASEAMNRFFRLGVAVSNYSDGQLMRMVAATLGKRVGWRLFRARTLLYSGLLALVGAIMLAAWLNRSVLEINVLHDRNPPFVRLSDGGVRNGYTVKILNKLHEPRSFELQVRGFPDARLAVVGMSPDASPGITVATDDLRELRVLVTMPREQAGVLKFLSVPIQLVVRDTGSNRETVRLTTFHKP